MKKFAMALAVLALAACGSNEAKAPEVAQASVLHSYSRDAITQRADAVIATAPAWTLTTSPRVGAFSAGLELGAPVASTGEMHLRIRLRVDRGAFQLVRTHKNWAPDYVATTLTVPAGPETTVTLPLIERDENQLLIIANGSGDGASVGEILAVELVSGPAPEAPATP